MLIKFKKAESPFIYSGKKFNTKEDLMAFVLLNTNFGSNTSTLTSLQLKKYAIGMLKGKLIIPDLGFWPSKSDDFIALIIRYILPHIRDFDRKAYIRHNQIVFYDGGFLGKDLADYSFSIVLTKEDKKSKTIQFTIYL